MRQYHTSSFLKKIHKILHQSFSPQSVKTIFPAKSASGNFSKLALIGFVFSLLWSICLLPTTIRYTDYVVYYTKYQDESRRGGEIKISQWLLSRITFRVNVQGIVMLDALSSMLEAWILNSACYCGRIIWVVSQFLPERAEFADGGYFGTSNNVMRLLAILAGRSIFAKSCSDSVICSSTW